MSISRRLLALLFVLLAGASQAQTTGNLLIQRQLGEIAANGSGAQSNARVNLGLGSMALQNSNNVAITGGTINGITCVGCVIPNPTLNANSLLGNPGITSAPGVSVAVGNGPFSGINLSSGGVTTANAPTTYFLTSLPDPSGLAGYYIANRLPNPLVGSSNIPSITLSDGVATVIASFVSPQYDPGAVAFPPGTYGHNVYVAISDATAVVGISVQVFSRNQAGTETLITGNSEVVSISNTTPVLVRVLQTKTGSQAMGAYDQLVWKVRAQRLSGANPVSVTLSADGSGAGGPNKSTVGSNISGKGTIGPTFVQNVVAMGAARNAIALPDGVIDINSNVLCSASGHFTPADANPPKTIEVNDMLTTGGTPFLGTIIAYISPTCVSLSGTATASTNGTQYVVGGSVITGGTGATSYAINDIVQIVGATCAQTPALTVTSLTVAPDAPGYSAYGIVNAGSGNPNGNVVMRGTTGTGSPFTALGIISGGVLASVQSFNGGLYSAPIADRSNEPVTVSNGATGIVLSVGGMNARSLLASTQGVCSIPLPDVPVATGPGSISSATGLTVNPSWQGVGRFIYFTNDGPIFSAAITQANATIAAGGRTVIEVPAGNYGITGAAMPIATQPIMFQCAGANLTQIRTTQGYLGAHIFGWSVGLGSSTVSPPSGPNEIISSSALGGGAHGCSFFSNRVATNMPDALIAYDLNSGMDFSNIEGNNVGSLLRTGAISTGSVAYLRESAINGYRCQSCGDANRPVMRFDSLGLNGKTNNINVNQGNIVFPFGVGFSVRNHGFGGATASAKSITADIIRVEQGSISTGVPLTADLVQIGGTDDTAAVNGVKIGTLTLVAPTSGANALGLYGMSEATRPFGINIGGISVLGFSLGGAINLQAGTGITLEINTIDGVRGSQVTTGNRTDNRLNTTADTGSTASVVILTAGATGGGATNKYQGGALVTTIAGLFTASINNSAVMTVTAMDVSTPGRIVVGATINAVSGSIIKPQNKVLSQTDGTPGGIGHYVVSIAQPVTSRALTSTWIESRNVAGYNSTTRGATVSALQGSAGPFTYTPQVGDPMFVQSLIEPNIIFSVTARSGAFDWSGVGLNMATALFTPLLVQGIPGTTQQVLQRLNFQSGIQIAPGTYPASSGSACLPGDLSWKVGGLAICTNTNSWQGIALGALP